MTRRPTVAIIYGFCEGPRVGRRLRSALQTAGFTVVRDAAQADIIIAHSGGCFIAPRPRGAQRLILVGIPFWPGRSMIGALWRKTNAD